MSRPTSRETTRRILEAALHLLAEVGYAGATMEAVANRAKTSKAALYRRWSDKPSLLADVVRGALDSANPVVPRSRDPRRDLRTLLHNAARALSHTPYGGAICVLIGAAQSEQELALALREVERERRWILAVPLSRLGVSEQSMDLEIDLLIGALYYQVVVRRTRIPPEFVDELCARLHPACRLDSR